jgi:hypothetical protein
VLFVVLAVGLAAARPAHAADGGIPLRPDQDLPEPYRRPQLGAPMTAAEGEVPPPPYPELPEPYQPPRLAETAPAPDRPPVGASLGLHWTWVAGKYMPGLALALRGGRVGFTVETSFVGLTRSAPAAASSFLGNQFGLTISYAVLRTERLELALGAGFDAYWLWNLHGDAGEWALATRAEAHYWHRPGRGLYVHARAYPVSTASLELGSTRDGERGVPVLFTTGIEWRWGS